MADSSARERVGRPRVPLTADLQKTGPEPDFAAVIGANLQRIRREQGISLRGLAARANVSRTLLCQLEAGQSTPTVKTVQRIARGLGIGAGALLNDPAAAPSVVLLPRPAAGASRGRDLSPDEHLPGLSFEEIRIPIHASVKTETPAAGAIEHLVIAEGLVEIVLDLGTHVLAEGDALRIGAAPVRALVNCGDVDACVYRVRTRSCAPR